MAVWYSGVCDVVLQRVEDWLRTYELGEVCKDQDFLTLEGKVEKKPTMYAARLPWSQVELSHLVRLMEEMQPGSDLTKEIANLPKLWARGARLPVIGGYRLMTLAFYKEHVTLIRDLLLQAKTGTTAAPIDEVIKKQKEQGKELFEV